MKKKTTLMRVRCDTKDFFKNFLPGTTDPKRMEYVKSMVQTIDLKKFEPEPTDTKQDRMLKSIVKNILGK